MTRAVRLLAAALTVGTVFSLASPRARADRGSLKPCDPVIRVRLARFFSGAAGVLVSCDAPFTLKSDSSAAPITAVAGSVYEMAASRSAVQVEAQGGAAAPSASPASQTSELASAKAGGILRLAVAAADPKWHRYRGEIAIGEFDGHLRITDDVGLEEYLCGVLGPEMGSGAPAEALKAQAVAARTYAIHGLGRLAAEDADLDDTTRTQSYEGVDAETPAVCSAVQETAGLVMTYDGAPIDAVYCTDCGGETAPGGKGEPYLQSVSDPACAAKAAWTKTYTMQELEAALVRSPLTAVTGLVSVTVEGVDVSGRAIRVKIVGEGMVKTVTGAQFRDALGADSIRSTLFTVTTGADGAITVTGRGWGHGEGLCQQGAIALAEGASPMDYREILAHYYAGVSIVPVTESLVDAAAGARVGHAPRDHSASSIATGSGGRS